MIYSTKSQIYEKNFSSNMNMNQKVAYNRLYRLKIFSRGLGGEN
jgi:hypothetical protein